MSAKQVAIKMLARREHSCQEIRRKLEQRALPASEIEQTIDWLQQSDLQSDARFAESYINYRKGKGYGPIRIATELKNRGVDESVYAPLLNINDEAWQAILCELFQKKYGSEMPEDYQTKARQIRFLQYRGFSLDRILEAVNYN